jgi:DNA-binding SARP family transcriptional activator/tetratricopeptide (TPR) repeat protein
MTKLVVRLLGGYRVELDGKAVYAFETDKARALLAYLMVEADRPHRRETLAGLLWPEKPDTVARANLRQTLAALRRALSDYDPPFFIFVSRTDLQFNAASDHRLDVAELEAFALARGQHSQPLPEALCADFLAGFSVPDSEAFEAWVLNQQEHSHRLALGILDDQNASFEATSDYDRAVTAARLQLRIEPWLEEAHRRCMRGLALAGRRDEALRQYDLCCHALETELGVEPASSTRALYADIRSGRLERDARKPRACGEHQALAATRSDQPHRSPSQADCTVARDARQVTFVARDEQMTQLGRHLQSTLAGETGLVFVSGDAGSGKTALLEAFAAMALADHPNMLVAGTRCNPGDRPDAFAPLRRLAESLFGEPAQEMGWRLPGESQAERLRDATDVLLTALVEHGLDLVGTLVPGPSIARRAAAVAEQSAPGPPGWWPALSARLQAAEKSRRPGALSQGALAQELVATLAGIARKRPLLLVFDDLHWVDEATAAFFAHLARDLTGSRLLLLGAYRSSSVSLGSQDPQPGKSARHPMAAAINEIRRVKGDIVVELDQADGRAFVEAYLNSQPNRLGARFRDALYVRTGGHALFTVELLRSLQERGELFRDEAGRWVARESLDWGALPAKVEAAIAERIDRVPDACRRILSAASAQGEEFSAEMVGELTVQPLRDVIAALSGDLARQHHLVRAEGLQRLGATRHSMYRFAHHLFQKYLYDQLDPVELAHMHAALGSSLERQIGDDPAERERLSARLARHYELGGLALPAARALLDAGRAAMRVAAFREALACFDHGLALLAGEPRPAGLQLADAPARESSPSWNETEQLLQLARLIPLRNLGTVAPSEMSGALAVAARTGTGETQDQSRLIALEAEVGRLAWRGQLDAGLTLAEQMLDQATRERDEDAIVHGHYWLGLIQSLRGYAEDAATHFDWILERSVPGGWSKLRAAIGYEITVHTLTFSGIGQWFLGYPDLARERCARGLALALELGDPFGQAFSSACGSITMLLVGNDAGLQEFCELCEKVCEKQGFAPYQHFAAALLGWLAVTRDADSGGVERIRGALSGWRKAGMMVGTDGLTVVLADACVIAANRCSAADFGERARIADIGLAAVEPLTGPDAPCGQGYRAELHRIRGELLLARYHLAAADEALANFRRALELAQERQFLGWELRAAMSIVRLRARQGEECAVELSEAQRVLAAIFARFTEGFDTLDLREAAALIAACQSRLPTAG